MARQKFSFQSSLNSSEPSSLYSPSGEPGSPEATPVSAADLIKNVGERTKSPLDAYKIIPRHKLRLNKRNDYPITEMEELEQYILQWGILQDILVIYSTEEDIYIVEAGHRRTTALDNLIKKYHDWKGDPEDAAYLLYNKNIKQYEKGYVCKVIDRLNENISYDVDDEQMDESVIDSEIRLIITNEGARSDIPAAIKARNISRLAQLYERKNLSLKRADKIKINETIAKQMNITERQVINYKNVDKLIPELQELFAQERFPLKVASSYSSLEPEAQLEIANSYKKGEHINQETVQALKKEQTKSKQQIASLEKELSELKNKSQAAPDAKLILSILFKNIENAISELNNNIQSMDIQEPLDEWIHDRKDSLKTLL